jgi:Signal transduction histidine kinase
MITLGAGDVLVIVLTAVGCTAAVTGIALLILTLVRRRTLMLQALLVAATAVAAVAVSTVAIAAEMYLSVHDLTVLLWVSGVSAMLSMAAAGLTAAAAMRPIRRLGDAARAIGTGEVVPEAATGWREFDDLAAELSRSSQRLAQARAEVDRLDLSRRQLIAWVSHDLRTPLAGIRALAEALEEGVAADPDNYLRQIRTRVDSVNHMVDALFELSKIHSGALQLHKEAVVLLDLVSDVVTEVRPLAEVRGIRIRQDGMTDQMLFADPREVGRVIANLLANSIRHAPENSEIVVSAHREPDGRLVLSVLDQGPGVAAADLGRMFEVGWRASSARTTDPSGSGASGAGLGLAIVQGIVEAHGGQVSAERAADGFRLNVAFPAPAGDSASSS